MAKAEFNQDFSKRMPASCKKKEQAKGCGKKTKNMLWRLHFFLTHQKGKFSCRNHI